MLAQAEVFRVYSEKVGIKSMATETYTCDIRTIMRELLKSMVHSQFVLIMRHILLRRTTYPHFNRVLILLGWLGLAN